MHRRAARHPNFSKSAGRQPSGADRQVLDHLVVLVGKKKGGKPAMSLQSHGGWAARCRLRAAAISAALEKIPSASFIVSTGGLIDQANARGRALLQRNRTG